ncbi:MAG: wax ester/triacylglycerol synthase family O-acyltransferase [Gammaproteobacteria bacterium]|nr:wax ester/triacylglycerol synthase family O-acyltransferase [Gammaproteobacteria bacterium]
MPNTIPMLDLMFFLTETQDNPRHVGSVLIFQKPKRGGERITGEIVGAYRRAKPVAPFNRVPVFKAVGLPEWREVDSIDPSHHVLHLALPAPGSNEQLHELVADLHAPMLERHRPGWKMYVIDGLEGDRFAIYHKVHHSLVDGESGMAMLRNSLATSPRDRRIRTTVQLPHRHRPRPAPEGLRDALEREARALAKRTISLGRGSFRVLEQAVEGLRGFSPKGTRAFTAPHTPMNDPIYNARSITHAVLPLARMKAVARAWDATLNDVALTILDAGINRYLKEAGRPPGHPLVALCPVSLHDPDVKKATTNVSAVFPPLGAVTAPIDERLRQVMASMRTAKEQLKGLGKRAAYVYAVLAFAMTETLVIAQPERLGLGMLAANVLVSNVRGPDETLYLDGAKLEAFFPVSTLIVGVGLNVTLMSYDGLVILGYTANGSALPEVESLARYTQDAFAALEKATVQRKARRRRTARPGRSAH